MTLPASRPHVRCTITGGAGEIALARTVHCGETQLARVPEGMELSCGDYVVIATKYGRDLARVLGPVSPENRDRWGDTTAVHRKAVKEDLDRYEHNTAKAEEAVKKMANQLVFGRVPSQTKATRRRARPAVKVLYFRTLFDADEDDDDIVVLPAAQPVQLVMFAP